MLAYVKVQKGWSIAKVSTEGGFLWWCASHEWVDPGSSYWGLVSDCWNVVFKSLPKARAFARVKGWER